MDTRVSERADYRPDPVKIRALATVALLTLEANEVSVQDALDLYLIADAEADAAFEAWQRREFGYVPAPAAMVMQEVRGLITRGVAA